MIRSAVRGASALAPRASARCCPSMHVGSLLRPFSSSSTSSSLLSPLLSTPLSALDPAIFDIIELEKRRQRESLTLIPSENFTSIAVLTALGSVMQNKYSEGYPHARYYGGNEFIDMAESLCQQRALAAFRLSPEQWGVNVQPHSGSPANFYVYTAVLGPHERMMALDLPHGGHLSHGYASPTKKVSAVSVYFEVLPYRLDERTGLIDYDALAKNATLYRPKLLVTGASAYPRHIDYARMRQIADINRSLLLVDMAHISGLVAAGVMPSPFEHADIVTTTTHKSLRGPRGAMIFYRKGARAAVKGKEKAGAAAEQFDLEERINAAVFPGHQGGPHNHTITALAVALKQAQSADFKAYQEAVLRNNAAFASAFLDKGYTLVSGGTDNHLILVDLRDRHINGGKVEKMLEAVNIAANKNTVPGDSSAMNPGGVRMGSPALTTRGLNEEDFRKVAGFVDRAIGLALDVQKETGVKMVDWKKKLEAEMAKGESGKVGQLRAEVTAFARHFPVVGFDEKDMKYH